jgi:hypothetical protein
MTIEKIQLRGGVQFPTGGEAAKADKPASRDFAAETVSIRCRR